MTTQWYEMNQPGRHDVVEYLLKAKKVFAVRDEGEWLQAELLPLTNHS